MSAKDFISERQTHILHRQLYSTRATPIKPPLHTTQFFAMKAHKSQKTWGMLLRNYETFGIARRRSSKTNIGHGFQIEMSVSSFFHEH